MFSSAEYERMTFSFQWSGRSTCWGPQTRTTPCRLRWRPSGPWSTLASPQCSRDKRWTRCHVHNEADKICREMYSTHSRHCRNRFHVCFCCSCKKGWIEWHNVCCCRMSKPCMGFVHHDVPSQKPHVFRTYSSIGVLLIVMVFWSVFRKESWLICHDVETLTLLILTQRFSCESWQHKV